MKFNRQHALVLILSSLVLGIFTDTLIRQDIFGLNFVLWGIIWSGLLSLTAYKKQKLNPKFVVYIAFTLLNLLMVYVRTEPIVVFWTVVSALIFMSIAFGYLYVDNFLELPLINRIVEFVAGLVSSLFIGIKKVIEVLPGGKRKENKKSTISLGVILAVVIGLVFIGLFSSSDTVFKSSFSWLGSWLSSIGNWFSQFNISRTATIVIFSAFAFSWLTLLVLRKKVTLIGQASIKQFLPAKDSRIILVTVSAIFTFYLILQAKYLFSGATLPDGVTYADYARRGYGELLVATILASVVVYVALRAIKTAEYKKVDTYIGLSLVLLNIFVAITAWKRLSLYESAYGWTMTRFVARMGLVCIFIGSLLLMGWVVRKVSSRTLYSSNWYVLAVVLLVSAMLNPVGIIVRRNITERPRREVPVDTTHMLSLSADSYKALCLYAPSLRESYPSEFQMLVERRIYPSFWNGESAEPISASLYPTKLNHGLSAHATRSQEFATKYYNCLQK